MRTQKRQTALLYEVALALMAAIEARGQRRNYLVERFKFNHV